MSAAENKQLMQQIFAELRRATPGPSWRGTMISAGPLPAYQMYDGKRAVLTELFGVCTAFR